MCFFFVVRRSQACKVSKVTSEKPFPALRPSMRSFEALCTDNFHDYAPLMLWVSSRPSSPFSLPLSLASCSFSRLNAAVKPFSVSVGLFYVAQFTWSRPRLAQRRSAPPLTALTTVQNPHTKRLQATKTEMNIAFHSLFYMSVSVCSVCVICVWLMPRSKVWHAKVLTICCQLANFLVITDSTLNYMYVNVSKRTSVCVCVCTYVCANTNTNNNKANKANLFGTPKV